MPEIDKIKLPRSPYYKAWAEDRGIEGRKVHFDGHELPGKKARIDTNCIYATAYGSINNTGKAVVRCTLHYYYGAGTYDLEHAFQPSVHEYVNVKTLDEAGKEFIRFCLKRLGRIIDDKGEARSTC